MKKLKYVIVCPTTCRTGGSIALRALCKHLNDMGENAKMYYTTYGFERKSPLSVAIVKIVKFNLAKISKRIREKYSISESLMCKQKYFPIVTNNTVVVWPETIGNKIKSNKNVRWLLNKNTHYKKEGDKTINYDKNDLFFCYREVFNDPELNPECRRLTVSYFDFDTYKRTNYGEREGKCYIVRKGETRTDLPKEFDGPIIDNMSEKEKVEWFNKCEYCISYDTQTAYSKIAAMCGCISIIVPEEGKTKYDYRGKDDSFAGVAYSFSEEEIKHAKDTACLVKDNMERRINENKKTIIDFVEICEKHFL